MEKCLVDKRVVDYLPLVRAVALSYRRKIPLDIELADLVSTGVVGLMDAAAKFDETKDTAFASYARFRIKGAIADGLRHLDPAGRTLRRANTIAENTSQKLMADLGRMPAASEIAEEMGISELRLLSLAAATADASGIAGHRPAHPSKSGEEATGIARATATETNPSRWCSQNQLSSLLEAAMDKLPDRHRKVVRQSFFEDRTYAEIGGNLGVHQARVSQIRVESLLRMAISLRQAGISSVRDALTEAGPA